MGDPITGLPGPQTGKTATPRDIFMAGGGGVAEAAKPLILQGSKSRDYGNDAADRDVIRAGTVLVKQSTTGKYMPWVLGALTVDYATSASGSILTVGAGCAVAVQKFLGGSTGTIYLTGSNAVDGTINNSGNGYETATVTAIDTVAGTLTLSGDPAQNLKVGTLIHGMDGYDSSGVQPYHYSPICIVGDLYGIKVTNRDDDDIDAPVTHPIIAGYIDTAKIVGWPPAAFVSLNTWVKAALRRHMPGLLFGNLYV